MSEPIQPVRLVALDLDGTLLNRRSQITPRTRFGGPDRQPTGGRWWCLRTGRALRPCRPRWRSCRACGMYLPPTALRMGPGQRAHVLRLSRYADAEKRHITQPVCLLQRLFPPQKAREVFGLCQQYEGERPFSAMDEPSRTGKVRIWLRRGWHDTALPKRTSLMTAVLPWCRI